MISLQVESIACSSVFPQYLTQPSLTPYKPLSLLQGVSCPAFNPSLPCGLNPRFVQESHALRITGPPGAGF